MSSVPASPSESPRERLARIAYGWLLRLLAPPYLLRLWWRGRAEPGYRAALRERFGGGASGAPIAPGRVWLHAVSLGETRAASALIEALRARRPGLRLLLTHGTATGREAGRALLREGDAQAWLPYDTPGSVDRFLARHRPVLGVLMETEVWPNLMHAARAHRVPVVLANARLSPKSLRQGLRTAALLRPAARALTLTLAQTTDDAARLRQMGAREVEVCGNLKFDVTPKPELLARGRAWRALLSRDVLLAAIFREGEEALLLAAWSKLPAPRPLLVIVPRHPQRFDEVEALIRGAGFTMVRRSSWAHMPGDVPDAAALRADAWLGDSMGEMPLYYALSGAALLGGSFEPLGGQNLIEAAACGCPVVMGPHTFNFAEAAALSLAAGAALRVGDMAAGVHAAIEMLPPERQKVFSEHALTFAGGHRGAASRMAARILALLPNA